MKYKEQNIIFNKVLSRMSPFPDTGFVKMRPNFKSISLVVADTILWYSMFLHVVYFGGQKLEMPIMPLNDQKIHHSDIRQGLLGELSELKIYIKLFHYVQ